jgi:pSer/pThr/pTyr-binding forkhead associated (FHA) protein
MPFIIFGRERFAISIGETRIGGTGDDALPFPELARQTTIAILTLTPDGKTTLSRADETTTPVTVNGTPLGAEPVKLMHGAKIEAGGVRLVFGDLRQHGSTMHVSGADRELAQLLSDVPGEPTADSGGRLIALATGTTTPIPSAGVVIGRDPECDVVLAGRNVSRRHAEIRPSIQGYLLTDTSTAGTYVNRRRVDGTQVLGMGDVIRIGDEELRFEADAATFEPVAELRPRTTAPLPVPTPSSVPLAATSRLLATLEIINEGLLKGKRFRLERPIAQVGRNPHNDVKLEDDTVSGSHATLTRRTSGWVLVDHGSTNGTYVDGERITGERPLAGVAELRFGGVKMLFRPIGGSGDDGTTKKTRAVVGVSLERSRKSTS